MEYYRKALAIWKKALGPEHPDVAVTLNNMGLVYWRSSKYDQAHQYLRKAVAIWETALGPEHPLLAWPLGGIGNVFVDQGRHHDALAPLGRAVRICEEKTCNPEPHGHGLFGLAQALFATGGDAERAIELARQAREVFGKTPNALKQQLEEVNAWLKEHGAE
jgi:tetratricopeptide (TPR) repeat protein